MYKHVLYICTYNKPRETKVRKVFIFQLFFSTQSPLIRTHLSPEGVNLSVARWPKFRPENSKGAEKTKFGRKKSWPNFGRILSKMAEKGPEKMF